MYQNILVPLDGSELAECVLPHVESIAKGCGVKNLIFLRVAEPFHMPPAGREGLTDEHIEKIEAQSRMNAEEYLNQLVSRVSYDGVRPKWTVISGRAADAIADYATKNNADLIIISTHGRSGVSRWVWGSVTDRILRSACVPVLMVRAPGCVPGI